MTEELEGFTYDPAIQSYVCTKTDQFIVSVTPMLFNDRVILTSVEEYPRTYTRGWCYDKGAAAWAAALVFDPDTQDAPVGFKKVAGDQS
jgi:hypothetical protein